MSVRAEQWYLGATTLEAGKGGIARVARMSARALIEAGADLEMVSLLDKDPIEIAGRRPMVCNRSRLTFAKACHKAAFGQSRFLYDAVGVARAHPRIVGLRKPYGVWVHGVEVWDGLTPDRERALRGAKFVLVNSQFTLDRFSELHWPLEDARVCWLATEDDDLPIASEAPAGPPTVLLIGRVDKDNFRKGHKEVVESWANVVEAVPEAQLLLAGGGDGLDLLRKTVAASPARDTIQVLGFVPEEDMPGLWARSHVFAQPSWKEGFGLVYIEAMRHGLPVIASVHDAGQEVNVDEETGYNVDLNHPGQLAERLIQLLQIPDRARSMGEAGRRRWLAHFRFSAFRKRFLSVLDDVAS